MPDEPQAKFTPPKELKVFPNDRQLCVARFSPCGQFLAAGAMGVWGAATATSNDFDPATGECVPEVVRGNLGNVFEDLECLIQETRYVFTHHP